MLIVHLPLMAMLVSSVSPQVGELGGMTALFEQAGCATGPSVLRGTFEVNGPATEEWAGGVRRSS